VEGPACEIKEAGGLFNIYAPVDRYMTGWPAGWLDLGHSRSTQRLPARASGPTAAAAGVGSGETKGRRGEVFLPHDGAWTTDRATGKTVAVEIDTGGRASTGGSGELD
jgi:hypothetical protein